MGCLCTDRRREVLHERAVFVETKCASTERRNGAFALFVVNGCYRHCGIARSGGEPNSNSAELAVKVQTQFGHSQAVRAVAFSPDGRLALSGSDDDKLKLWEVASGREIGTFFGHDLPVRSVAFSRMGSSLCLEATMKLSSFGTWFRGAR